MKQAFQTFRFAVFTALLTLALFLTPFDFISNAQSSGEQEVQTMASALDENQNRVLDDSEILNAIQLWILGDSASGDDTVINDASILSLVQQWITGEPIRPPLMGDDDGTAESTDEGNAADSVVHDKLYWSSEKTIYRCELANCDATTTEVVTLEGVFAYGLTANDTNLFWLTGTQEYDDLHLSGIEILDRDFYGIQTCEIANCSTTVKDVVPHGTLAPLYLLALEIRATATHLYLSYPGTRALKCEIANCWNTLIDSDGEVIPQDGKNSDKGKFSSMTFGP